MNLIQDSIEPSPLNHFGLRHVMRSDRDFTTSDKFILIDHMIQEGATDFVIEAYDARDIPSERNYLVATNKKDLDVLKDVCLDIEDLSVECATIRGEDGHYAFFGFSGCKVYMTCFEKEDSAESYSQAIWENLTETIPDQE